jgi:hypothetical protein
MYKMLIGFLCVQQDRLEDLLGFSVVNGKFIVSH